MSRPIVPIPSHLRAAKLRRLVAQATRDRGHRLRGMIGSMSAAESQLALEKRKLRAASMILGSLRRRLTGTVDCAAFFERLVGRLQLASGVIGEAVSSIRIAAMDAECARLLAVVVSELVAYLEASVPADGAIRLCVAIALEGQWLAVAVGADGDVRPVTRLSATASMLAAREIVSLMDGEFERGLAGKRLVFGLTFPASLAESAER